MENIDNINIVEIGKNGEDKTAIGRFADISPSIILNLVSQLKALGFGDLLDKLKLDPSILADLAQPKDTSKKNSANDVLEVAKNKQEESDNVTMSTEEIASELETADIKNDDQFDSTDDEKS